MFVSILQLVMGRMHKPVHSRASENSGRQRENARIEGITAKDVSPISFNGRTAVPAHAQHFLRGEQT